MDDYSIRNNLETYRQRSSKLLQLRLDLLGCRPVFITVAGNEGKEVINTEQHPDIMLDEYNSISKPPSISKY